MARTRGLGAPPRPILWSVQIEVPASAIEALAEAVADGALAVSVLSPPRSDLAKIEALFDEEPPRSLLTARVAAASASLAISFPEVTLRRVPDLDWLGKVAGDFPPFRAGRFLIFGGQHRRAVGDRRRALEIDATSAFGTGEHPTTQGCLLLFDDLVKMGYRPRRALDMGCGSGILALAYLKSLPGFALGIDLDYVSVQIARANARINGRRGFFRAVQARGYQGAVRGQRFDLIFANIFAGPLAAMAKDLKCHLAPGGHAILSGFLGPQMRRVIAAHRLQDLTPIKIRRIGEWAAILFEQRRR